MKKVREEKLPEMYRFQENMDICRKLLGWSCDEFGAYVGLSRQTVYNIETGKSDISKTQYIAMRSVIDSEILSNPEETKVVALFLKMFVDSPDEHTDEERKVLKDKINLNMPSIAAGTATRKIVSDEIIKAASILIPTLGSVVAMLLSNDAFIKSVTKWIYASKRKG